MKRSLQSHLSLMLGGAVLIAALVAALASFILAYSEAKEFQDDMLRQVAELYGDAAQVGVRSNAGVGGDPESRILILHLPGSRPPAWLAADLKAGFHTLDTDSGRLRVYIHDNATGARTVLAQPTEVRDEIAVNSALRTLIPLLLLLPLLAWLVVRIVRRGSCQSPDSRQVWTRKPHNAHCLSWMTVCQTKSGPSCRRSTACWSA